MRGRDTIFSLYARAYPHLLATLSRLTDYVQADGAPPVTLLVLFGSVAELTAGSSSDADLLALFDTGQTADAIDAYAAQLIRTIRVIEGEAGSATANWPISMIPGSATARELDTDFLENIGHEGVLVYHREGSPCPEVLSRLEPYGEWAQQVHELLAALPRPTPSL